ncbi:Ecdysteroid UDP-glucosyltransferase [Eumeta japonica]|uniref:UDP-glucuronosyltransferase n=1 Tax=Eumeta variegata TaxID=151549 RepID=A0A4C1VWB0_EUMVA|nr:Ecdysteroid UDP-glucosyltransferase [Eumeta japonica]
MAIRSYVGLLPTKTPWPSYRSFVMGSRYLNLTAKEKVYGNRFLASRAREWMMSFPKSTALGHNLRGRPSAALPKQRMSPVCFERCLRGVRSNFSTRPMAAFWRFGIGVLQCSYASRVSVYGGCSLCCVPCPFAVPIPDELPQRFGKQRQPLPFHDQSSAKLSDLQKLMDNAKDGVIYFSMGSNLKSKFMPEKMKREFLETFSKFKQTVLWKFEDVLPDLPSNVHIIKWGPQQSILAHPNCILFVTHGGMLSTTEAVHFGVPIIGIPVIGDQHNNVKKAVRKGFAMKVDLSYDTPKELKSAIEEVLSNPRSVDF